MTSTQQSGDRAPTALTPGVREQLDRFFFGGPGWSGPVGTIAVAVTVLVLGWPHLDHDRLTVWATCVFVVALAMLVSNMFAVLRRPVTSRGIPWVATVLATVSGVAFGAVPWLDIEAVREQSATIAVVAVLLGASALSAGAMTGAVGLGRFVIYPMWLIAAAAMFYIGEYGYGAAGVAFMFLLGRDMTSTRDLLFEILYQREQSQDQAQHAQKAAHRDPLTGLLNRAGLEAATAAAAGSDSTITVMFIDLDHFKSVNDRFGHAAGDELLKEVAERLLRTVRPGDIVARLGGDEFLLVFLDELTEPVRDRLASAVISNLELPFEIGNLEARISASLGITVVSSDAFDLGAVQREADHALYVAKAQGRRRSVHFDKNLRSELDERSEIETELRRTISSDGIDAWAQPIVDLERGSVVAVELLARWRRSDGTYCPPSIFVPLAEEIGLIGDLGQQMLEHAGHTLATWRHDEHLASVAVSVNVSPRQLRDESFVPRLRELFQRRELRQGSLILELTETAELHDLPDIDVTLAQLVETGALLALDDFGSGYSSVQHLIGLPIEYVKLDGTLVRDLGHDPRQIALVRSIRDLAATLGRIVVVEGVETEAQARQLADLRFQLAQGFYYGPARPIGEFASTALPGADPRTAYAGPVSAARTSS